MSTPMPPPSDSMNVALRDRPAGAPPDMRVRDWSEPQDEAQDDEPIIDAARVPLSAFRENQPGRKAYAMYLWLHVLRPLLLVAFWIGVAFYCWRHFFEPSRSIDDTALLTLYGVLVGVILVVMLVLAPLRRKVVEDEDSSMQPLDSPMSKIAESAGVPADRLSGWQQARRLSVLHDEDGRVSQAADLDTEPALLAPQQRKRSR